MSWADALFRPRSVAVVGSSTPGKLGAVLIEQMLDGGFGRLSIVGPKARGVSGVPGFASIAEIPEPPDLVVVASPAATVVGVIEDAGRAGAQVAVILTAGFSETGAQAEEARLLDAARPYGLRLVGPNCAGIVNTKWHLFPTLETRPPSGDVAFISQSGALGGAVLSWAEEQGMGLSKFVSYGNGADLTDVDFLEVLRVDDETKVVALYLETVSDGRRFLAAAKRLAAVKPVVVIKSGRSASGSRATQSHTGSLAGVDAVYDAALRQAGAIRVDGIEEMFDLCRGFATLPPPRGRRLVIVTNSGGPGVLAADAAERAGLELPSPGEALRRRLQASLPSFCSLSNPIDLTVQGTEDDYRDALVAALDEYDAALAIDVNTPYLDSAPIARGVVAAARATNKPIAASFLAGKTVAAALPVLRDGGVPHFATGERAVEVLAAVVAHTQRTLTREPQSGSRPDAGPEGMDRPLPWAGQAAEPEVLDWLEREGLPVPARRLAASADEAADAVRAVGRPVAIKIVASTILHKSDVGGVRLGIETEGEARAVFAEMETIGRGKGFRGVLVVPMAAKATELIVGLSRDPQFGPVVAVGLGGIYAEILRDVALRIAPIDAAEARAMFDELRGAAILHGARGAPARDLEAAAKLVADVSRLPFRYVDLAEMDLNPVFLFEDGLVVGDARVIRRTDAPSTEST